MIALDPGDYGLVDAPLRAVAINHLFAGAVVRGQATGTIHVDDRAAPRSFYIAHPYGMSLLFGRADNPAFNAALRAHVLAARAQPEWLQAWPQSWHAHIAGAWADVLCQPAPAGNGAGAQAVALHTRVNFRFNRARYHAFRLSAMRAAAPVRRIDEGLFGRLDGSVVPAHFWPGAAAFCADGTGYCVLDGARAAAWAFAGFVADGQLEIGLETMPAWRGLGYAVDCCIALIDECLARGLEPVWACRLANTPSYRLAQKLGFEPTLYLPYYRLAA